MSERRGGEDDEKSIWLCDAGAPASTAAFVESSSSHVRVVFKLYLLQFKNDPLDKIAAPNLHHIEIRVSTLWVTDAESATGGRL